MGTNGRPPISKTQATTSPPPPKAKNILTVNNSDKQQPTDCLIATAFGFLFGWLIDKEGKDNG